ncbi:MAG: DNA translocase FtsK [Oscillospiraceae bacterium]
MATRQKQSGSKKAAAKPAAKKAGGQKQMARTDLDRRWSILLFGLGLFFVALAFIPGESGWAWIRGNILFGTFGISGWVLGAMVIWWAVLVSLQKPVFGAVIKGILLLFALSGAALVFGTMEFKGLGFAETLAALLASGRDQMLGGGLISFLFGWTLLALAGRVAARVLLVLIVIVAAMVVTGVTPGDIVRFFRRTGDKLADHIYEDVDDEWEDAPQAQQQMTLDDAPRRRAAVDVPLEGPAGKKDGRVDIDLGPDAPHSEPGLAENDAVEIGPGGTFGQGAVEEAGEMGLGDFEPLIPFDPYSPEPLDAAPKGDILLFGEHDPYTNLGGAQSRLPKANRLDVEYIPADDPAFDLFGAGPAQPAKPQLPKEAPAPPSAAQDVLVPPQAPAAAAPDVDALIERAAAREEKERKGVDTRGEDESEPYRYPPITLFGKPIPEASAGAREEMKKTAELLVGTLDSFGVQTRILDVSRGPSVTRYEIQPQAGVKISRITGLADDIALNLAAAGVRIEAPIPGKPAVGIEVPNRVKSTVPIRSILESDAFTSATSPLSFALGKDIAGEEVVADLTKMPHLLIAGSTGSGKSVCINAIIMSVLYKSSPDEVRMVLIDPKVVELAEYNGIPHLLMPVVTEPRQAAKALGQMVAEMERRYHLFAENGARDITSFNRLARRDGTIETLPHVAIVIDELADLMMAAGKDVENFICRIAQKARAAGMHLIVATQRPSVDVITGLIKANIPSRIAFAVSSQVDSRTILDGAGAEKLLGMGDMLFMPIGANKPVRVQGTFVKDKEISAVLRYVKNQGSAQYDERIIAEMDKVVLSGSAGAAEREAEEGDASLLADATFVSAVEMALDAGEISTSGLQRRLRLGYARAGRIVDEMERLHIVSEPNGSKPRQVLISRQQWQEMVMNAGG